MRITPSGIWAFTKWLMVIAVAYFSYNYFQNVQPIYTGKTSLDKFDISQVDPGYEMNIIVRSGNPIQIDSILTESNGQPEYHYMEDGWYLKTVSDGKVFYIKSSEIIEIYYVKKGK